VGQEERERVVDLGIAAFEKALAIDSEYFDALAYINLIYREKAKALAAVGLDTDAREAFDRAGRVQATSDRAPREPETSAVTC
jgi:hypothetical protein